MHSVGRRFQGLDTRFGIVFVILVIKNVNYSEGWWQDPYSFIVGLPLGITEGSILSWFPCSADSDMAVALFSGLVWQDELDAMPAQLLISFSDARRFSEACSSCFSL